MQVVKNKQWGIDSFEPFVVKRFFRLYHNPERFLLIFFSPMSTITTETIFASVQWGISFLKNNFRSQFQLFVPLEISSFLTFPSMKNGMLLKNFPIIIFYFNCAIGYSISDLIESSEELSTVTPTAAATLVKKSSEYFNYDPYSKWGPDRWDDIKVKKSEYFDFTKVKKNQCDGKKQSPINIRKTKSCQDDHITFTNVSTLRK